jgi:predicted nucleic acid-binding protein
VLRAEHSSLRLPDALVIATAAELDADHLLSTDRRWAALGELGLRGSLTVVGGPPQRPVP